MKKRFLTGKWNIHKLGMILTAVYLLSLIPLLLMSWYNYPAADDFSMALEVHRRYMESGSFWQALAENISMTWYYYTKWMGYYTSDFLMSMPPSVFGERFYVLGTWLLLGMFSMGTIYFLRALLVKAAGMNRDSVRCISMIVLFISVQCMQEGTQRTEAFYWYAGAINYFFLYGVGLVYLGLLISAIYDSSAGKRRYDVIMAAIIGFLMGGANFMSALCCAIISVMILGVILLQHVERMRTWFAAEGMRLQYINLLTVPTVLMLTGFACSCFAPGNRYRAAALTTISPVKAVLMSLYYTLSYAIGDWTTWAVICLLLLTIPLFWHAASTSAFSFRHPFLVILFLYAITSAAVTPPLYAEGNIGAGRIQSIFWAQYVLCIVLAIGYLTGWVHSRIRSTGQTVCEQGYLRRAESRFLVAVMMLWLFGSLLSVGVNRYYYSATSAITDLLNGNARTYAAQWQERYKVLQDESVKDVVVTDLTAKPELLFFSDISQDADDWTNAAMCKYFDKDSIVRR